MRWTSWLIAGIFLSSFIAGCGGGSGSSTNPPSPGFTVSLSSSSINLTKGGAAQNITVSIAVQGGFAGSVNVNLIGVTAGVTTSPSSLSIPAGSSGTFTLNAASNAAIVKQSAVLESVSGSIKIDTPLQLNVNGAANPDPFHPLGGSAMHGFYDQVRQTLFVANPALNELDVVSGLDLSVRARLPVPQAWSVDQMSDNKTLVIGTASQEIVTVDEDTLAVTRHPVGFVNSIFGLFYPVVIAMANGKVFMIGQEQGIDSSDIGDGGQFLLEWDSIANTFSLVQPVNGQVKFEVDRLSRSADHKWAVFSADQFYLYSSDTDSFTTASLAAVNPPLNTFGIRGYAINSDGTEIAIASAEQVTFIDRAFNVLGTTPIPSAFQTARTSVAFTPDNSRVMLQYDLPTEIEMLDARQFTALGFVSAAMQQNDNSSRLLGTDPAGRIFIGTSSGFLVLDGNSTPVPNPSGAFFNGTTCPLPSARSLPLNSSGQFQTSSTIGFLGTSLYVGGQPAPYVLSSSTSTLPQIQVPASSVPGVVDFECVGPDGNTLVAASAFSYGANPIGVSANLLPPIGNPTILVFGYGFSTDTGTPPSVTVGGQPVLQAQALGNFNSAIQGVAVRLQTGAPGQSASVAISSSLGSGTLPNAVTYIPGASIIPATGLLQLLYDTHRSLLYALKASEIDVFNPVTQQFQAVFQLPGFGGTDIYNVMALSPDGTRLIAASPNGYVAVLNPDNPAGVSVVPLPAVPSFQTGSLAVSKFNKALLSGFTALEVDLTTLGVRSIPGQFGDLIRASADGNFLYGINLNVTSGQVFSIDPVTYASRTNEFGFEFWSDLAVSPDGSHFAGILGSPNASGTIIGLFDPNLNWNGVNEYPFPSPPDDTLVLGSVFGPQGKVLVVPLGDSIEFWDFASGTLRARLMTPEELAVFAFPEGPVAGKIALDALGQTIFAISQTGITVMNLPQPVDDIPAQSWSLGFQAAGKQINAFRKLSNRISTTTVRKAK
jgi:hypothetical protein